MERKEKGKSLESTALTLNPAVIERLHQIGGDDLVNQMIQLFLQNASQRITTAGHAVGEHNFELISKSMRALNSSAGDIGAERLEQIAMQAESLADEHAVEQITALLHQIESEFQQVRIALESGKDSEPV